MKEKRLIDANALREVIAKWAATADNSASFVDSVEGFAYDEVLDAIDAAPTVDPETLRPVAQWEGQYDGYSDGEPVYDVWECSNCGHTIDDGTDCKDDLPNYCPACGAKMEDDNA